MSAFVFVRDKINQLWQLEVWFQFVLDMFDFQKAEQKSLRSWGPWHDLCFSLGWVAPETIRNSNPIDTPKNAEKCGDCWSFSVWKKGQLAECEKKANPAVKVAFLVSYVFNGVSWFPKKVVGDIYIYVYIYNPPIGNIYHLHITFDVCCPSRWLPRDFP